eukprot:COSAG04_NODE_1_length_58448_cov_23.476478_15_plen_287_part_00
MATFCYIWGTFDGHFGQGEGGGEGGEARWPSDRFAHDGRDASELRQKITFLSEPKQMMLLKPDGSDKHARHFWLEAQGHTVCWSKKAGSGGKKRALVSMTQAADCVIFHTGGPAPTSSSGSGFSFGSSSTVDEGGEGAEVVQARMESEEAAARYVEAGSMALQDRMAQVAFTDIDGEELAHTLLLPQVIPTPSHVLGRISPIFSPFFPVFCAFSPSRRGGSNEPKTGIQGHETVSRAPKHRFSGPANSGCSERMAVHHAGGGQGKDRRGAHGVGRAGQADRRCGGG